VYPASIPSPADVGADNHLAASLMIRIFSLPFSFFPLGRRGVCFLAAIVCCLYLGFLSPSLPPFPFSTIFDEKFLYEIFLSFFAAEDSPLSLK